jgi:hypothetical protein
MAPPTKPIALGASHLRFENFGRPWGNVECKWWPFATRRPCHLTSPNAYPRGTNVRSNERPCLVTKTQVLAAREEPSVAFLNFSDAICSTDSCSPIVCNVLVWRDNEHLTATYASSLDGVLGTALDEIQRRRAKLLGPQ